LAVGLAVDCDNSPDEITEIWLTNMPDASRLPFVAVLTSNGKWIDGYSGFKQAAELQTFLEAAAKSPLLNASAEVRAKLAKQWKLAKAAADKGKWKKVVAAYRVAQASYGRCEERDGLRALKAKADAWMEAKFAAVTKAAVNGEKLVEAKKMLLEVRKVYAGGPEAEVATIGMKAIPRLNFLRKAEKRANVKANLREKIAAEFKGTRWTALFDKPTTAKK